MIYRMRELALIIMRLEMLMIVGGTYQKELTHTPPSPCNDPHMNADTSTPYLEDTSYAVNTVNQHIYFKSRHYIFPGHWLIPYYILCLDIKCVLLQKILE